MYNFLLLSILRSCGISSETCYLTEDYWIFLSTGLQRDAALRLYHQVKTLQQPASVLQRVASAPSLDWQSALEREERQNIPSNNITEKPLSKPRSPLPSQVMGSVFQNAKHFPAHSPREQRAAAQRRVPAAPAPTGAQPCSPALPPLLLPTATKVQAAAQEWNPFCSRSLANAPMSKVRCLAEGFPHPTGLRRWNHMLLWNVTWNWWKETKQLVCTVQSLPLQWTLMQQG